jgi:hypothetical protein
MKYNIGDLLIYCDTTNPENNILCFITKKDPADNSITVNFWSSRSNEYCEARYVESMMTSYLGSKTWKHHKLRK